LKRQTISPPPLPTRTEEATEEAGRSEEGMEEEEEEGEVWVEEEGRG
jgi:hypothetical protein